MTKLLAKIRACGGDVRLDPADNSKLQFRGCAPLNSWKLWKRVLIENKASVIACLKEERASRAWQSSNHDRTWWKVYPYSQAPVAPACTCNALSVPHHHAQSGPDANVVFEPSEDVWSVLALIVRAQGNA